MQKNSAGLVWKGVTDLGRVVRWYALPVVPMDGNGIRRTPVHVTLAASANYGPCKGSVVVLGT